MAKRHHPDGWIPTGEEYEVETDMYGEVAVQRDETPGLKTDKVTVNMGPQHPSTHGVFRMVVTLDGETIVAPAGDGLFASQSRENR